ncbi:MAG: HNH endonuclease [Verrucomicrobiota bacterium]
MPTKPLDRLMFAQGGHCFFCKQPLSQADASVEHLFASANGGGNEFENCVACCKSVNALFGSMSLKEKFQVVLNQKGQFKCPNGVGSANAALTLTPQKKTPIDTKLLANTFDLVVANLSQRGDSRPRTLKALTSTVAAIFSKKLDDAEINTLIQQLQSTGKISVVKTKITYAL